MCNMNKRRKNTCFCFLAWPQILCTYEYKLRRILLPESQLHEESRTRVRFAPIIANKMKLWECSSNGEKKNTRGIEKDMATFTHIYRTYCYRRHQENNNQSQAVAKTRKKKPLNKTINQLWQMHKGRKKVRKNIKYRTPNTRYTVSWNEHKCQQERHTNENKQRARRATKPHTCTEWRRKN